MKLTRHGEILREEASRTLDAARSFRSRARHVNGTLSDTIRGGTIGEPIALQFGEFLSNLLVAAPQVTVSITQGISGETIERALALDAGFAIGRPDHAGLEVIALAPVTFVIAAPAWKDRVASANWQQLGRLPWIGTPQKCSLNRIAAALFARNGVDPKRAAEADQDNLLRSMAEPHFASRKVFVIDIMTVILRHGLNTMHVRLRGLTQLDAPGSDRSSLMAASLRPQPWRRNRPILDHALRLGPQ